MLPPCVRPDMTFSWSAGTIAATSLMYLFCFWLEIPEGNPPAYLVSIALTYGCIGIRTSLPVFAVGTRIRPPLTRARACTGKIAEAEPRPCPNDEQIPRTVQSEVLGKVQPIHGLQLGRREVDLGGFLFRDRDGPTHDQGMRHLDALAVAVCIIQALTESPHVLAHGVAGKPLGRGSNRLGSR